MKDVELNESIICLSFGTFLFLKTFPFLKLFFENEASYFHQKNVNDFQESVNYWFVFSGLDLTWLLHHAEIFLLIANVVIGWLHLTTDIYVRVGCIISDSLWYV